MEQKTPPAITEITHKDIGDSIVGFSSPPAGFRQYLVLGSERALLVDTGIGIGSLRDEVEKITKLPVTVINTHAHPDHAGGNAEFAPALMNPADFEIYSRMASLTFKQRDVARMPGGADFLSRLQPDGPPPIAAEDGEVINLGGRSLRVVYAPGHTRGSLCVFEASTGVLFTGDNVQPFTTSLSEDCAADVETYRDTLRRLIALKPTKLLSGHSPDLDGADLLERKLACADKILDGAVGQPSQGFGPPALRYIWRDTAISYRPERLHALGQR